MRECLKCKKSIEDKNESAKFCSTSCRVMYHRKHGKTKAISTVQVQVLYNSILDMVEKIGGKSILEPTHLFVPKNEHIAVAYQAPIRSFEYYRAAKKEIENEEDWLKMKNEIEQAPNLTPKQRNLLLTTNI